ncbi:MAG: lipopolysaccharide biosynthesis protein [Bacilli bacterium]|nr:lipopolysaccharide biosynthesis protein [Bacilli bacterium]
MIDLLYSGNEKVFDGVLTSLLSIVMRDESHDSFRVTILTMDLTRLDPNYTPISDKLISFLDGVMKKYNPESSVRKVDVTDLYEELLGHSPNEGCYCSPYTLLRLLADKVDGFSDRLLYLDADIMFNRDIHLLTSYDISEYEFAGANDHYGKYLINPRYMNAGVLYFNMDMCRKTDFFAKARAWIWKKKLVFADQSAILRAATKRKLLPQRFNDQKFLHEHTVVRHFSKRLFWLPYPHTANIKQWKIDEVHKIFHYHQFDDIYEVYLKEKAAYEGN